MCERCRDLDYQVADCWRPCYVPRQRGIPLIPRGSWSDQNEVLQHTVDDLLKQIKALRHELKQPAPAVHKPFEGVE